MSTRKKAPAPKAMGAKTKTTRSKTSRSTSSKDQAPGASSTQQKKKKKKKASEADGDAGEVWTLRLYVTGRGERSERALSNLHRLCESTFSSVKYKIEVVDLLKNPELARDDQILAIPTLVRKLPEPMKRIIGDLSDAERAMLSLDFPKHGNGTARP